LDHGLFGIRANGACIGESLDAIGEDGELMSAIKIHPELLRDRRGPVVHVLVLEVGSL